jgi:hypothetical protein
MGCIQFRKLEKTTVNKPFPGHQYFSFIDCFFHSSIQIVVTAFHPLGILRESDRLIQGVILYLPLACKGFYLNLVAVFVVLPYQRPFFSTDNGSVLVEAICFIDDCNFFRAFPGRRMITGNVLVEII